MPFTQIVGPTVKTGSWRRESLRATLWLVPGALVVVGAIIFVISYSVDRAAYRRTISLPKWVNSGSSDAARQVLIGLAAATITVAGVVFSITIVALTLASQQFGPRMMRNFIRDRGTQFTLGMFVATFVFDVLALGSITSDSTAGDFIPHLSITIALALVLGDLVVFIYFIHHVTKSIQLPHVIAGIAHDLEQATDKTLSAPPPNVPIVGLSVPELTRRIKDDGVEIAADRSGYLQFVGYSRLVRIAAASESAIQLLHRPGHFVIEGRPLARVWPASAGDAIAFELSRRHITGPHRTLTQDPIFAIDQLVEIAIRALSPAVNDTFTALACIDWLGDGLCKLSAARVSDGVHRDRRGYIRLIEAGVTFERMVNGAYDKIRQAGRGMPAVSIRQLDSLGRIMEYTMNQSQRVALLRQAGMIINAVDDSVSEPNDRADARSLYDIALQNAEGARTLPPRVASRQRTRPSRRVETPSRNRSRP